MCASLISQSLASETTFMCVAVVASLKWLQFICMYDDLYYVAYLKLTC